MERFSPLETTQRTFFPTRKGKTIAAIAAIMILALAGSYTYYSQVIAASQTAGGSQVQTAVAQRGDLAVSASGTGTLIAQTDATFGFNTSGLVTDVYVKIGDQVEAGQVLAQLDSTLVQMKYEEAQQTIQELYSAASIATVQQEIGEAQDTEYYAHEWLKYLLSPEVVEAEENLAIAQQKLIDAQAEAKANPSGTANQAVSEKEQAVAFLTEKLTQAQAYYENTYLPENFGVYENVGSRRNPKRVLATTTDPVTGEEVPDINRPSAADIATARNNYIQAQEAVQQGKIYLEALNSGVIPDNALGARVTALYQAQLAVEDARSALDETQLIAPISGTVTSFDLNIGEQAGTSSVITISQLSQPYILDVYLDETDWDMAKLGNKVTVTLDLLPEQAYPGTVTLVSPELSPSFETSLVHIIVQLDQSISQDLPAGTGANVDVVGGEAKGVVLISVDAVHKGDDGKSYVTVIQNGEQSERAIEIGLHNDLYVEVKSGLEAGELVVAE